MTNVVEGGADTRSEGLPLDPFSFLPGVASRLPGFGGNAPGHDPAYAFHTRYVKVAPGRATFTIRLHGLTARRGTLVVRVHMLPQENGAHARLVNSERITFNRLITLDGEVSVSFEAFRNVTYAVYGMIPDETDARADRLTILLDRPDDGTSAEQEVADARSTSFGTKTLMPVARLLTLTQPTLADPVSQMCTASQLHEGVYASWAARLQQHVHQHRRLWESVYILQVLDRYELLEAGARGLGFAVETGPLPAVMAARGVEVVATYLPGEEESAQGSAPGSHRPTIATLRHADLCDDAAFGRLVSLRPAAITPIPPDLVNFDFAWSVAGHEQLASIGAGVTFIEETLNCLRPGGLAVHVVKLGLTPDDDRIGDAVAVPFRRRDLERLALNLISRGHEVAQLNLTGDDLSPQGSRDRPTAARGRDMTASFGIIVRKALSPF